MTKKNFQSIANAVSKINCRIIPESAQAHEAYYVSGYQNAKEDLMYALRDMCAGENINFDSDKFLKACQGK